jgi:hypothetical protein
VTAPRARNGPSSAAVDPPDSGAGTVGFSGHELATYVYDDFQRPPLAM